MQGKPYESLPKRKILKELTAFLVIFVMGGVDPAMRNKKDLFYKRLFKNSLVPKFKLLSEKEVQAVLKKYHVTKDKLPKILASDPVAKYLKAKPGDVIMFIRKSRVAGESVAYRVVVEV